ncbi:MAG: FprA family A-type flavoprotein [Oscillospiraceae bacterium]
MYCTRKISDKITWIGANDRRPPFFEGTYPVPEGVSYNSYLISDEKTCLVDTADKAVAVQFEENLSHALGGRKLDYIFIEHMEPDHCAVLSYVLKEHPEATVYASQMAIMMVKQFFDIDISGRSVAVKDGSILDLGTSRITFYSAPMVHWPEVMVGFMAPDNVLFSADAFGTFGCLDGSIFSDDIDFERDWLPEGRRYYCNIVGKYGQQTAALLAKVAKLDVSMICPLHGPVIREDIGRFVDKYSKWASYEPEEKGVLIAFASVYGDTKNAAEILAGKLYDQGVKNTVIYDVSITHPSYILAEAFRMSNIVLASTTYNTEIFETMQPVIHDFKAHMLRNRCFSIIENGSWAPNSGALMKKEIESLPCSKIIGPEITIKSALKESQLPDIEKLSENIAASMK